MSQDDREARIPRVGIAVFIVRDGRILLGKRRGSHGAETWATPGGHLEFGESIEDCARREVMEETGLVLATLTHGPFTNTLFKAEGKHYVTLFMLAQWIEGEAQLREPDKCYGWDWFDPAALPTPLFPSLTELMAQGEWPSFSG